MPFFQTAFSNVGKSISDGDASNMLAEAPGPVNFTQLVTLFAQKMAGGKNNTHTHLTNIKLTCFEEHLYLMQKFLFLECDKTASVLLQIFAIKFFSNYQKHILSSSGVTVN